MVLTGDGKMISTLERESSVIMPRLIKAMTFIGEVWVTEAKKRIPVDEGTARNHVLKEVTTGKNTVTLAVGGNLKYMVYIEFGTKTIAGGRVKQLGLVPNITDAQAVKSWPAKSQGLSGVEPGVAANNKEQMPWLRTSFMAIRKRAIRAIDRATGFE